MDINTIINFIKSKKKRKKSAIIYIDYEHWYYSYVNFFNLTPNLDNLLKESKKMYTILDVYVFANFFPVKISKELCKLKAIKDIKIIEIPINITHYKKDMTDFVMVDYIYKQIISGAMVDTFIIITGDGHFYPVTNYLVKEQKKEVIVYGVRGSISQLLKNTASSVIELPTEVELRNKYYNMILQNFIYSTGRDIYSTLLNTEDAVSQNNKVDPIVVRKYIQEMIDTGYLYIKKETILNSRSMPTIHADWPRLVQDGIWEE